MKYLLAALLLASPAAADIDAVIDDHILPGYAAFAAETAELDAAAAEDCSPETLRDEWHAAFDAWMRVSHLRLGPVEEEGRALSIAFWPDTRGVTPRALAGLIADEDPIIGTPEGTARLSVAARGFFALEFLLFDEDFADGGAYTCALIRALSADLAAMAADIDAAWRDGFAETLRSAGAPGNDIFLSELEGRQALFTALTSGLEFTARQRLGRPLGTFERPRPRRAEARRSGRSLRNVRLSLAALQELATTLASRPIPKTEAAFARARELAHELKDPVFAGVETPQGRLEVEIVQQAVELTRNAALGELGPALGVSTGFNATDGD